MSRKRVPDEQRSTYRSWRNMIMRCYLPSAGNYAFYGGRGIAVCEEWRQSFEAFLADMGPRPSQSFCLDRVDPNGNYCKANCRWAPRAKAQENTRRTVTLTIHGIARPVSAWARLAGIHSASIFWRLRKGWSPKRAVFTPIDSKRASPRGPYGPRKKVQQEG